MTAGRVIAVSGLPGAGKSTTARLLAAQLDRAAHIEADQMQKLIVSGGVLPDGHEQGFEELAPEARLQLRLRLQNSVVLARSLTAAGFDAVIDDLIIGSRLDDLLEELEGIEFFLTMLQPSFATLVDRWGAIGSPFVESWAWMDDELQYRTQRIGLWLDTTTDSPEQVADRILSRLDEARVSFG